MQNLETQPISLIEAQQLNGGINTEAGVSEVELSRIQAIRGLEQRVQGIAETFDLAPSEEQVRRELELARGKHLIVGYEPDAENIYFYVSSRPAHQGNWSEYAVTCGHSVDCSWVQEEDSPLSLLRINTWTIDPGGEFPHKSIDPSRDRKTYNLPAANFAQLSDIGTQFNKVISYFEEPTT